MIRPSRIDIMFRKCELKNKGALGVFICGGDPDLRSSLQIIKALPAAGADMIELGIPCSDPVSDGPSVQRASQRSLEAGTSLIDVLALVGCFRAVDNDTPVALMGYYKSILAYGKSQFLKDATQAGVDALIIPDLPQEDQEFWEEIYVSPIDPIRFLTPAAEISSLSSVLRRTRGFLYHASHDGLTGMPMGDKCVLDEKLKVLRNHSNMPVAIGFGIRTAADVRAMVRMADAAIVGSVVVDAIGRSLDDRGRATEQTISSVLSLVEELASGTLKDKRYVDAPITPNSDLCQPSLMFTHCIP
jgi:tryptophan synthase alpha chain